METSGVAFLQRRGFRFIGIEPNGPGVCAVGDFGMHPYPPTLFFVQGTMLKLALSPQWHMTPCWATYIILSNNYICQLPNIIQLLL
jgi:hypothetical protein